MERKKCVCCEHKLTQRSELFRIKDFPITSNSVINPKDIREDMCFSACPNCYEIQLNYLVDIKQLYENSHNTSIIGKLWKQHYIQFKQFLINNVRDFTSKNVLEVGDPNYKNARLFKNEFKGNWTVIDPNCQSTDLSHCIPINSFFEKFEAPNNTYSVIIHSHLLEHIYEPMEFLRKCYKLLPDDGIMCFSIPNMTYISNNFLMPFTGVFFEHTYHLSKPALEYMLSKSGFLIKSEYQYQNHSNFYCVVKGTSSLCYIDKLKKYNLDSIHTFNQSVKYLDKLSMNIKEKINDTIFKDIYVYSAHYNSQVLIYNLPIEYKKRIKGFLDNDPNKQGKYLYGSNKGTYSPQILKNKNCIVITSHCGVYKDEITEQLIKINSSIIIV